MADGMKGNRFRKSVRVRNQNIKLSIPIKNIDLPQKLHRRTKAKRIQERKRVLGRSIEQRTNWMLNFIAICGYY